MVRRQAEGGKREAGRGKRKAGSTSHQEALMKRKLTVTAIAFSIALGIGYMTFAMAPVPGDPVPGVDVSIEQSPSGVILAQTQTNSNGFFEFRNLQPGKYRIKWGGMKGEPVFNSSGRASNNYNSAKSNTAGLALGTKDETWNVSIEFNPNDVRPGSEPGVLITIGAKGGKVSGLVTKASQLMSSGRAVSMTNPQASTATILATHKLTAHLVPFPTSANPTIDFRKPHLTYEVKSDGIIEFPADTPSGRYLMGITGSGIDKLTVCSGATPNPPCLEWCPLKPDATTMGSNGCEAVTIALNINMGTAGMTRLPFRFENNQKVKVLITKVSLKGSAPAR